MSRNLRYYCVLIIPFDNNNKVHYCIKTRVPPVGFTTLFTRNQLIWTGEEVFNPLRSNLSKNISSVWLCVNLINWRNSSLAPFFLDPQKYKLVGKAEYTGWKLVPKSKWITDPFLIWMSQLFGISGTRMEGVGSQLLPDLYSSWVFVRIMYTGNKEVWEYPEIRVSLRLSITTVPVTKPPFSVVTNFYRLFRSIPPLPLPSCLSGDKSPRRRRLPSSNFGSLRSRRWPRRGKERR